MNLTRILSLTATLALLVACGTTPSSSYYMLSAKSLADNKNSGPSLALGPVSVPDYLSYKEMVFNSTANQLERAEYSRWAESLDAGILRVTAINLANLLDTQRIQAWPWRRDNVPEYAVKISVAELSAEQGLATLVAAWTVNQPGAETALVQRISNLQERLQGNGAAAVAQAYSNLLEQLAGEIADTIKLSRQPASDS